MRICLLSQEYPTDTEWGGIGTYTYEVAHGLVEIGHEVEVITLASKETKITEPVIMNDGGIKVHYVPWQNYLHELTMLWISLPDSHHVIKTNLALWSRFIAIHESHPFDVVEAPEHLAGGLLPALAGLVPLVLKLHTPPSKLVAEKFPGISLKFDNQLTALFERMAMLCADVLISPSQDLANYIASDLNYPKPTISIVRNPVDPQKFSPDGPRAITSDGQLTVLFAGRLEAHTGIEYLVDVIPEIIQSHPNTHFVIVGKDTNTAKDNRSMLATLKAKLKKSGYASAVTFTGPIAPCEMPAYYRSADICVFPALYGNIPYACLEAMSCGKPIVGTTAGGIHEYLQDGQSGIVIPPADKRALASAILSLLQDTPNRNLLGANARQYVLNKLDRTKIAASNVHIYKQAQSIFDTRRKARLYRRDGWSALADAKSLIYAYNKMFYDMLYQLSFAFRFRHWKAMASSCPRLMLAKIAIAAVRACLQPFGLGHSLIQQLQMEISHKGQEHEAYLKQQLGCSI